MSQAIFEGVPTYEIADTSCNDLEAMMACCNAEEESYWSQRQGERLCAAPFYFERAAILSRKAQAYEAEIEICRRWKEIARDYASQPMVKAGHAAKVHLGPRSKAIKARYVKAKELASKAKRSGKP